MADDQRLPAVVGVHNPRSGFPDNTVETEHVATNYAEQTTLPQFIKHKPKYPNPGDNAVVDEQDNKVSGELQRRGLGNAAAGLYQKGLSTGDTSERHKPGDIMDESKEVKARHLGGHVNEDGEVKHNLRGEHKVLDLHLGGSLGPLTHARDSLKTKAHNPKMSDVPKMASADAEGIAGAAVSAGTPGGQMKMGGEGIGAAGEGIKSAASGINSLKTSVADDIDIAKGASQVGGGLLGGAAGSAIGGAVAGPLGMIGGGLLGGGLGSTAGGVAKDKLAGADMSSPQASSAASATSGPTPATPSMGDGSSGNAKSIIARYLEKHDNQDAVGLLNECAENFKAKTFGPPSEGNAPGTKFIKGNY